MAKNLSAMYNQIVNAIIRPPRAEYEIDELGDSEFTINGVKYRRDDFQIKNKRNLNLECSHFSPVVRPQKLPCVIYLHGNCGCRLDAMEAVRTLLPLNVTVLCFDFSGSGLSQGDYVSLGHFEKQDLISVVDHMRASNSVTRIGLWGRSMGAVTAILYSATDPSMACVVLDSPFSNLRTLAFELLGKMEAKIPKTIAKIAFKFIEKSVEKKAKFDIGKLDPIKDVELCFNPSLFAHAEGDDFIDISHSRKLYDKYPGDKNIIAVEGDHNSERPEFFFDSLTIFFKNHLLIESDFGSDNPLPEGTDRKKFLEPTPEASDTFQRAFRNLKMSDSLPHSAQINDMLFGNGNFGGGGSDESDDDFMLNGKGALTDEDEELRQAIMLSMQSTNVEFLNREGALFEGGQSTAPNGDEEDNWAEEIRRIEEATKREEEKRKLAEGGAKSSGSDSSKDKSSSNKEPSSSGVDNSSSSTAGKIVSPRRKESKDKSGTKDKDKKEKKSKDKSSAKDKSKDKTKDKKEKKDKK
jgi:fermentation-respiration switch protein FrsA (DUF1100 family)